MKTPIKFGKRTSSAALKAAADTAHHVAIVREWMGEQAPAHTVQRLAAAIARRAA